MIVISEDAHRTDNIVNMASTPRVLPATGFVYCETKTNPNGIFNTSSSLYHRHYEQFDDPLFIYH